MSVDLGPDLDSVIDEFLAGRTVYTCSISGDDWDELKEYHVLTPPRPVINNEAKDVTSWDNCQAGDLVIAYDVDRAYFYGIGVVTEIPESQLCLEDHPGLREDKPDYKTVFWTTIDDRGEEFVVKPIDDLPSIGFESVTNEYLKKVLRSSEAEDVTPTVEEHLHQLIAADQLRNIDPFLDAELPDSWNDSETKQKHIRAVVIETLLDRDSDSEVVHARERSKMLIASVERADVEEQAIESKIGIELFDSVEDNEWQANGFDPALTTIEQQIRSFDRVNQTIQKEPSNISGAKQDEQTSMVAEIPPNADVYVQRGSDGPYRENLGTSLTTPLTEDLRAELQDMIVQSEVDDPTIDRLYDLLNDENITAWGTRSDHEVARSMNEGDQVIYVERGPNRSKPFIRYQQKIDLSVPEPTTDGSRYELQTALSERIWRDDGFTSLWFSTTDLSYYENPSGDDGYEAFNEVLREVEPNFNYYEPDDSDDSDQFPWWFTSDMSGSSLVHVNHKYIDHYGGPAGFIEALCQTTYVGRAEPPSLTYLVIDQSEIRERDFKPVVHEYDGYDADPADSSPDPRVKYVAQFSDENEWIADLLIEADVNGYALIRDGNRFVAKAKLGCAFGKKADKDFEVKRAGDSLKIASLVDYRTFRKPVPTSVIDHQIGIGGTSASTVVTQIDAETYNAIFNAAISQRLSEEVTQLVDQTTLQKELLWVAAAHLVAGKNVVFYGPPGTGKTYTARRLTEHGFGAGLDITTAHAELTNYDLIGGYAPEGTDDGDISWQSSPGSLTNAVESCVDRLKSDGSQSWLLVDELNRANLDQAFGDVFTLLDQDYRDTQFLEYGDETQRMPYSFRLVATMNTSDQAKLFSLGYAFRRRFGFVPTPSLLDDHIGELDYDDIETPDQTVPNRDELKSMVANAVKNSLTTKRILIDGHGPVVYPRDAVTIDPMFARHSRIERALEAIKTPETFEYSDTDGINMALELSRYINSVVGVDIGHTLMIDIVQFLIGADLITDGDLDRSWLDWAITTQLLPQLDDFLGEVREEETIGSVTDSSDGGDKSPSVKLDELTDHLDDCGLPRSKKTLEAAVDGYQLI